MSQHFRTITDADAEAIAAAVVRQLADRMPTAPSASPAPDAPVERLTYTRKEAAEALGVCETTLWRLEALGHLKTLPGIRHKKYSAETIRRYLAKKAD